jgi:hypothetical protein
VNDPFGRADASHVYAGFAQAWDGTAATNQLLVPAKSTDTDRTRTAALVIAREPF